MKHAAEGFSPESIMSRTTLVREGTIQPEQEKSAVYIPFTMPEDAVRVDVAYEYTNPVSADPFVTGGNTLDVGIFDERGVEFLNNGVRGWCGSERDSFFIARQAATPGFVPGPILAGEWNVYLGLYKIGPSGCSYKVTISFLTELDASQSSASLSFPSHPLPAGPPRALFGRWLRGQIHCHSSHSDGDIAPADLVTLGVEQGLDFLAITDHNTNTALGELYSIAAPELVLIRGMEVTTYFGHWNVWGISDWIDFRARTPEQMEQAIAWARERGALISCNHPKPFGPPWEMAGVDDYDCIEVWNGPWNVRNPASLDFWTEKLKSGRRIPAVGGSDFHRPPKTANRSILAGSASESTGKMTERLLTNPTVWVYVPGEASEATILDAIRAGHVTLSEGVEGPVLELNVDDERDSGIGGAFAATGLGPFPVQMRCRNGAQSTLRILDDTSVLHERLVTQDEETVRINLNVGTSRFVRAELWGQHGEIRALTNPIYLVRT